VRRYAISDAEYIEAEHDGYTRLDQPVIHRRRLLRVRPHCWIVADDFRGKGVHTFNTSFHFAAEACVERVPRTSLTSTGLQIVSGKHTLQLAFFASNAVHTEILQGATGPLQGWVSRSYGNIRPAPVLCTTVRDEVPSAAITVLISRNPEMNLEGIPVVREQPIKSGHGTACVVDHGGIKDLFIMPLRDMPLCANEFTCRGEFFWVRYLDGQIFELFCINARHASIPGCTLFDHPSPVSCIRLRIGRDQITTMPGIRETNTYVRH
jgi:hypothetical protein